MVNIYDGTHQTPNYVSNGIPFYSVEQVTANQFEKTKFVTLEVFEKENKRVKLEKGDILMTRIGSIGVAKYMNWDVNASFYVSLALIKQSNKINNEYLCHFINTNFFQSELWKRTIHVAFPQKINLGEIGECFIKYPSSKEQQKISLLLTSIETRFHTQKKIIDDLIVLKNSAVKKLFESNIKFKNDNGNFPKWEKKRLNEISKEHLQKNPNNLYPEVFSVSKHKGVVNQIEHLGRSFSAKEITHYKLVYPGDLVYTKSPTSEFPFGIIKQNRTGRIGVVSPLYCVFTPQTFALGYLLHEYFSSSVNTFNYLNPLVQKGAKNTMNINNDIFLNGAKLLLPMNEEEQNKIYNFLSLMEDKIDIEKRLLTQFENQKKYLLANLFV